MQRKTKKIGLRFKFFLVLVLVTPGHLLLAEDLEKRELDQRAQMQKRIEEIMKHREEMMKSLFNDDSFQSIEKHMLDMMKNFDNDDFKENSFFSDSVVGEYNWKEDDEYKTLSLKVKQIKDRPLDIKIEKGQIKIKGDVEEVDQSERGKLNSKRGVHKTYSKVHFERIFTIPSEVDEKNPQFENKDGELLIKFKKKRATSQMKDQRKEKAKEKQTEKNIEKRESEEERMPIRGDSGDIAI